MVGNFLRDQGQADLADDLKPFRMILLHFRRTFVEKLFTVHGKVERLKSEGHPLGRHARHYADLYALAARPEIEAMLRSNEYQEIKTDYDERSRNFFADHYRPPADLRFINSDGVFLPTELRARIKPDYEVECQRLFPGPFPTLDQVVGRLERLRELL